MLIAIIGGIGSGKSTLLNKFRNEGKFVIDADKVNKNLLNDTTYIASLAMHFPTAVDNGTINTKILKNLIFNDDTKRQLLNALAHDKIMGRILDYASGKEEVFVEMPLFNEDLKKYFSRVIFVYCPYETRKIRVLLRDQIDETMFDLINKAQFDEEKLKNLATEVYING